MAVMPFVVAAAAAAAAPGAGPALLSSMPWWASLSQCQYTAGTFATALSMRTPRGSVSPACRGSGHWLFVFQTVPQPKPEPASSVAPVRPSGSTDPTHMP